MRFVNAERKKAELQTAMAEYEQTCPDCNSAVLAQLLDLHMQTHEIELECYKDIIAIQRKFVSRIAPIDEERRKLLSDPATAVPEFWKTVLMNHAVIRGSIEKWDVPVLNFISDISVRFTVPEDMHSFAIDFAFYNNNPYFSNRVLTKEFMMRHDSQNGEWMLCQAKGTDINWREDKNIISAYAVKKQRSKVGRDVKTVVIKKTRSSFFNFFRTRVFPTEQDLKHLGSEELHRIENLLSVELEIGQILRDRVIPDAFGYFFGVEGVSEDENDEY